MNGATLEDGPVPGPSQLNRQHQNSTVISPPNMPSFGLYLLIVVIH